MPTPPDPRSLLRAAGLRPKKAWSQNFLRDANILDRIARETGAGPDQPVIELGAGLGALTYHLLARGGPVVAVERDPALVPLLEKALAESARLDVVPGDALHLDYAAYHRPPRPLVVAGNLPYHIASRILVRLAESTPPVARGVFLIQKEVAERLTAPPGSRTYGLLTVLVQRSFRAQLRFTVPPQVFLPPPKVASAVVTLQALEQPWGHDSDLATVARAAFSRRRKTLRNALRGGLGLERGRETELEDALAVAGLVPTARAETVEVAAFARLGRALRAAGLLD